MGRASWGSLSSAGPRSAGRAGRTGAGARVGRGGRGCRAGSPVWGRGTRTKGSAVGPTGEGCAGPGGGGRSRGGRTRSWGVRSTPWVGGRRRRGWRRAPWGPGARRSARAPSARFCAGRTALLGHGGCPWGGSGRRGARGMFSRDAGARVGWCARSARPAYAMRPKGGSEGKPPRGRLRGEGSEGRPPARGGAGGLGALLRGARCYLPEVFAAFAAFAAAFISCLWARTFARDSGPLMSATERKESGSP